MISNSQFSRLSRLVEKVTTAPRQEGRWMCLFLVTEWLKWCPTPHSFPIVKCKCSIIPKERSCVCYHGHCIKDKPGSGQFSVWRALYWRGEEDSRHLNSLLAAWRRILQIEWQTCNGGQMSKTRDSTYFTILCLLISSVLLPVTPKSIAARHVDGCLNSENASGGHGRGRTCWSGREWGVCLCACVRVRAAAIWKTQIKGWKQHFVFCQEWRSNTNSLLFIKPQITIWHSSLDVELQYGSIQHVR